MVEYAYDTWGKKVQTTGSLAGTLGLFQPFRYRGYVYDWETGFYYLQSRYYDPTTGRFISADVLLSTGQGVLGYDCYAYCLGNPVIRADYNGTDSDFLEWLKSTFGAEARTTYRQKLRNKYKSVWLFFVDCEIGTETSFVSNSSGNSSKPISVYVEERADNWLLSSAGLRFNIGSLSIDYSLGVDNAGVTLEYDRGNGNSWSLGWGYDFTTLKYGLEYKDSFQINDFESESTYVNVGYTLYGLAALAAALNGDYQPVMSPSLAWEN